MTPKNNHLRRELNTINDETVMRLYELIGDAESLISQAGNAPALKSALGALFGEIERAADIRGLLPDEVR